MKQVSEEELKYAFEGNVIRLTEYGLKRWRIAYPMIEDLIPELQKADDYYTQNPLPDGKWFFPVSCWLARANENLRRKREPRRGVHIPGGGWA